MSSPIPPPTPPKVVRSLSPPPASSPRRKSPSFSNLLRPSVHSTDDKSSSSDSGATEKEGGKLAAKVKDFFSKDKRTPSSSSLLSDARGSNTGAAPTADTKSPSTGTTVTPSSTTIPLHASLASPTPNVAPLPSSSSQAQGPSVSSPPGGNPIATPSPAPAPGPSTSLTSGLVTSSSGTSNALQISITGNDPLFRSASSIGPASAPAAPTSGDQFRRAVETAQTSVDRMQTAAVWLGFAGQALSAASVWLPMVGPGVQAVVQMLEMAKAVGIAKVAALRLVERCADILFAVMSKLRTEHGQVSLDFRQDINRLLTNVHNTAFLLTKLANRPFFKLWLHAGEVQDQIAEATGEIECFFNNFHVQAAMTANAMLEQARLDREADQLILRDMIQEGIKDENVLLTMLVKKADEQQEAIKTLQRALDNIRYQQGQAADYAHSPGGSPDINSYSAQLIESPPSLAIGLPGVNPLWLPGPSGTTGLGSGRQSTSASFSSGRTDTSHLSVQAQTSDNSAEAIQSGSVDEMGKKMGSAEAEGTTITPAVKALGLRSAPDKSDPRRIFIEKALDVLRRRSASTDYGVPDWTITSLEITHELRLANSFFSTIWRGKWQGETVAIKELHRNIDRSLFISEVEVWRRLRSKHVLPFFGASSTTGPPPWFMVSPYMQNGNVLNHIRKSSWSNAERRQRLLHLVREMAEGMEYLHSRDIYHGDFKAANVLVSDIGEALICDFGLSRLKSDLTSRSDEDPEAHRCASGTMRWQSPQRLLGKPLTPACDVYAFAVTICELYSVQVGQIIPYGYVDDVVVRQSVLDGHRPDRPDMLPRRLWALIERCWAHEPEDRPTFEIIVQDLISIIESDKSRLESREQTPSTSTGSFDTAPESIVQEEQHVLSPQLAHRPLPDDDDFSSSSGSIRSIPQHLAKEISFESDRAERHYRHYLNHDFDDRLSIPLWFPAEIPLGSVGYIRHGRFVRLLDATRPSPDIKELPPVLQMDEFAALATKRAAVNVQNVADKGWGLVHSAWMNFIKSSGEKSQKSISRQYPFPLKPGGKQAVLVVDDADFEIYKSHAEARAYLIGNIDWILKYFGDAHHIAKEDVIIVVGTLSAKNYAMAVSQFAPRTTLMFNVHTESQRKPGEPWGTWTVNRQRVPEEPDLQYICKVSTVAAGPRDAVLLAKLKFPQTGGEPVLYQ